MADAKKKKKGKGRSKGRSKGKRKGASKGRRSSIFGSALKEAAVITGGGIAGVLLQSAGLIPEQISGAAVGVLGAGLVLKRGKMPKPVILASAVGLQGMTTIAASETFKKLEGHAMSMASAKGKAGKPGGKLPGGGGGGGGGTPNVQATAENLALQDLNKQLGGGTSAANPSRGTQMDGQPGIVADGNGGWIAASEL
jgi:hypothetical protein